MDKEGEKKGRGWGFGGGVKKICEALKDKLLRYCVKSQLGHLTATTFSLTSRPCDLLKTHLTLALMAGLTPPCMTDEAVNQGAFKVKWSELGLQCMAGLFWMLPPTSMTDFLPRSTLETVRGQEKWVTRRKQRAPEG